MIGNILVGDLLGKEGDLLGQEDGVVFGGSLPLLLVGDSQGVFNGGGPKNVFVVNAHRIFLQKVLENFQSFHKT